MFDFLKNLVSCSKEPTKKEQEPVVEKDSYDAELTIYFTQNANLPTLYISREVSKEHKEMYIYVSDEQKKFTGDNWKNTAFKDFLNWFYDATSPYFCFKINKTTTMIRRDMISSFEVS